MSLARVHRLLDALSLKNDTNVNNDQHAQAPGAADGADSGEEAEAANKKALHRTQQMKTALQVTATLWDRNATPWQGVDTQGIPVNWGAKTTAAVQRRTKKRLKRKEALKTAVGIQSRAYAKYAKADATAWRKALYGSKDAPNEAQALFLDRVIQRCEEEHTDFRDAGAPVAQNTKSLSEPMRACLFGIPGAGKSHCIHLLRRFFEECLRWEDGVQFQFLAHQNTMAALIGGKTVNTQDRTRTC